MTRDRAGYRAALAALERCAGEIPNTRLSAIAKVTALVVLNVRWEAAMVDRELAEHPFALVERLVADAQRQIVAWREAAFIEGPSREAFGPPAALEEHHRRLFQALWVRFSRADYRERIARYERRLRLNGLADGLLAGRRCVDLGCGHGNFAHALHRAGAAFVLGVDYGEDSIDYAIRARDALGVTPAEIAFRVASVYAVPEPDASFGFAVQNGVFHHLEDEDRAYREALRLLEPGGWLWIYTDGEGGIGHDLWDASARILREVPAPFVLEVLDFLNVETNKRYHLGDGLNAIYRHTSWDALTERLARLGFGEFRRLVGGFPTDFDHDVIAADWWGREKFGEGDLRLLARRLR